MGSENPLRKVYAFPREYGTHLSIDEVSLSKGELYTFVTNKKGRGKKGSLVACIKDDLINVLENYPYKLVNK